MSKGSNGKKRRTRRQLTGPLIPSDVMATRRQRLAAIKAAVAGRKKK